MASLSYGQFKVVATGENQALHKTLVVGSEAGSALARVIVGRDRTATGGAAIDFLNGDGSTFGTRFSRGKNGLGALTHQGGMPLQLITQNAAPIEFKTSNATLARLTIQASGQVDIRGNATVNGGIAVTSDLRKKKNISDLQYGLDEVLAMRPVSYEYTGESFTPTNRAYVGLVAQELAKIAPDFVSTNTLVERNEDGEVLSTEEILQIHDSELKYILVKAIQEQQELIKDLEEKLNSIGDASSLPNRTQVTLEGYDLAELSQNRPNPFNVNTTIDYVIPTSSKNAQLNIIGLNGQTIKSIDIEHVGEGSLDVNTSNLPSGTYSYQLVVDGKLISTEKMTKTK